tara:strand:+ start:697 stop:813 length:117 start_codon:yes stop_codon:yes gene_type:complete
MEFSFLFLKIEEIKYNTIPDINIPIPIKDSIIDSRKEL